MHPLLKGFKSTCRPADRRTPWEWCESNVVVDQTSPMPGPWRSDSSPWVKPLMEVFADNHIRDIAAMCSAQASKTQTMLNLACWAIAEDPGPAMWVMKAKDEAKQFVRDRAKPTFDNCKPVAESMVVAEVLEFVFGSVPFYFTGAGSPSKLQSKPIRWLFLDEVRNYDPGALDTVLKRTRAFWNSRRVLISTPGRENDEVHRAFLAGDQRVFHIECPRCTHLQPLKFEQLKALNPETQTAVPFLETSGIIDESGLWDFDKLAPLIRYECVSCKHLISDTPAERKRLARNGRYIRMNPSAPRSRVSFHWNALLPPWVAWRSIVEEWVNARFAARSGDTSALKTFYAETLGIPWEDQLGEIDDYDFLEHRKQDYEFGEVWPESKVRFMAADRQEKGGEHYYWVIREFGMFGKSRLVAHGRCSTPAELEETRKEWNVKVLNCMIDSGHKAHEVYRFCLASGWKAFKGDDKPYYLFNDKKTGKAVRKYYRKTSADPHIGTKAAGRSYIPLFTWANDPIKDMLAEMMKGYAGEWTMPRTVSSEYLRQITAERREEKTDHKGRVIPFWRRTRRDNHYFDCECMILVAAIISKMIQGKPQAAVKTPNGN